MQWRVEGFNLKHPLQFTIPFTDLSIIKQPRVFVSDRVVLVLLSGICNKLVTNILTFPLNTVTSFCAAAALTSSPGLSSMKKYKGIIVWKRNIWNYFVSSK